MNKKKQTIIICSIFIVLFSLLCFFSISKFRFTDLCDEATPLSGQPLNTTRASFYIDGISSNNNSTSVPSSVVRAKHLGDGFINDSIKTVLQNPTELSEYTTYHSDFSSSIPEGYDIQWHTSYKAIGKWIIIGSLFEIPENTTEEAVHPATTPAVHVMGSNLVDASDNPIQLRGLCYTGWGLKDGCWSGGNWPTWYNNESLNTVKEWGVNILRIPMTVNANSMNSYAANPAVLDEYIHYVDMSLSNGFYTIIEWGLCDNPNLFTNEAKTFFDVLSSRYADNPYVIYDICNEPFNASWADIKSYCNEIVPVIREKTDNLIIVAAPYYAYGYTDNLTSVANDPLPYYNISYGYHYYVGNGWEPNNNQEKIIRNALSKGINVFISEWGCTQPSGAGGFFRTQSDTFVSFIDSLNLSWINFNFSDCAWATTPDYSSSICKAGEWNNTLPDNVLTDSGLYIKCLFQQRSFDSALLALNETNMSVDNNIDPSMPSNDVEIQSNNTDDGIDEVPSETESFESAPNRLDNDPIPEENTEM